MTLFLNTPLLRAFKFCRKIQGLLGVKLHLADQELDLTLIAIIKSRVGQSGEGPDISCANRQCLFSCLVCRKVLRCYYTFIFSRCV
jgi:hypothetical protein